MQIVIIDYGSGNLQSVKQAFEHVVSSDALHASVCVSSQASAIANASHIVLPGVGAFNDCMRNLQQCQGMLQSLQDAVFKQGKPFLGICVGQQMMSQQGFEGETVDGLGWVSGKVKKIIPANSALKVPHMGWNDITLTQPHPVLEGSDGQDVYFTHSWSVQEADDAHVLATCDYSLPIVAATGKDNYIGTQFHPEKSQAVGLRILKNFIHWKI